MLNPAWTKKQDNRLNWFSISTFSSKIQSFHWATRVVGHKKNNMRSTSLKVQWTFSMFHLRKIYSFSTLFYSPIKRNHSQIQCLKTIFNAIFLYYWTCSVICRNLSTKAIVFRNLWEKSKRRIAADIYLSKWSLKVIRNSMIFINMPLNPLKSQLLW